MKSTIFAFVLCGIQIIFFFIKAVAVSSESTNRKLIIACDIVGYSCCAIIILIWVASLIMPIP